MPNLTCNLPRGRPIQKGQVLGRPFKKGEGGRPPGARNKLKASFLEILLADFEANGADAIRRVREEEPATYLKVIASLLPKEDTGEEDEPLRTPPVLVITAFDGADA